MTTSPDGEPVPVGQRLADICARYGPGHTVTRTITKSTTQITMAVQRVSDRIADRAAGTATENRRASSSRCLAWPARNHLPAPTDVRPLGSA